MTTTRRDFSDALRPAWAAETVGFSACLWDDRGMLAVVAEAGPIIDSKNTLPQTHMYTMSLTETPEVSSHEPWVYHMCCQSSVFATLLALT